MLAHCTFSEQTSKQTSELCNEYGRLGKKEMDIKLDRGRRLLRGLMNIHL